MFKKSKKGYYFWEEFVKIDGVVHGFSTRKFGDMNWKKEGSIKNLGLFCDALQIDLSQVVRMEQVHGSNIKVVDHRTSLFRHSGKLERSVEASRISTVQRDSGQARMTTVDNTDGLISFQRNVFLTVTFADCVPVLFFDKDKRVVGIAHAGWKGVFKEIVKRMIGEMIKYGSKPSNLIIGIGPSIRVCCYNINEERERVFKDKFPKFKDITNRKKDKIFLDLVEIVKLQLKEVGILDKNILDCKLCTKDNILDFYSFRREHGKPSFGLCAGTIGRV